MWAYVAGVAPVGQHLVWNTATRRPTGARQEPGACVAWVNVNFPEMLTLTHLDHKTKPYHEIHQSVFRLARCTFPGNAHFLTHFFALPNPLRGTPSPPEPRSGSATQLYISIYLYTIIASQKF